MLRPLAPLFSLAALLSLACGLAQCGLWLRSHLAIDAAGYYGSRGTPGYVIATTRGLMILEWGTRGRDDPGWDWETGPPEDVAAGAGRLGWDRTSAWFPIWLPIPATLLLPALWLRRRRTRPAGRGFPIEARADA